MAVKQPYPLKIKELKDNIWFDKGLTFHGLVNCQSKWVGGNLL